MTDEEPVRKATKQSTLITVLMVISIALIVLSMVAVFYIINSDRKVDIASQARYELTRNARRFMLGSSYLTSEVRAYAATSNQRFRSNYWNEVNDAQNREIAIENMIRIGITEEERELADTMMALSYDLTLVEEKAMLLAREGDRAGALGIVYGEEYERRTILIRAVQTDFLAVVSERTNRELAEQYAIVQFWMVVSAVSLSITAFIQVLSLLVVRYKLLLPLVMVRDEMAKIEKGALQSAFDATPDTSEMGMLIGSIKKTKAGLNLYLADISEKLSAIALGDSSARIEREYPGDFVMIKESINTISHILAEQRERDEHSREDLRIAYEEANAANRAKSNFLSNMSHEIRTPMNAIVGMTNIALASDVPERRDKCLQKISDASSHLLGVINDILDMSKIDANRFELAPAEFNFEKMMIRVVNIINFRVDEKKQRLDIALDPNIPVTIVGDDQRLAQVITNVMSNAVKFTPESGRIFVEARLREEIDGMCKISIAVTDSGIGISSEQQAKLFTSFSQADAGISRKFGGTGLGLAISKNIVEKMGGRIWVDSKEGEGSRFEFEFLAQRGTGEESTTALLNGVKWDELHVLVVDDDSIIREYFQNIAAHYNFHCDVASDGHDAQSIAEKADQYDIFFIDWKMPGIDGIELARKIRDMKTGNSVVIMISSTEWAEIEGDARAAGADKFIPKPLFMSTIIDMIGECLGAGLRLEHAQEQSVVPDYSGLHILLAEDIEINREIVQALLEPTGVSVICAENGQVALNIFAEEPDRFCLIFMDLNMPEMDGSTATIKIRELDHPHAKKVPIVAMTANVFREDIEKCLEVGMNAHVGKPLDFDEVLDVMKKFLR